MLRAYRFVIRLVLVTMVALLMTGCSSTKRWNMNGVFVHADGSTEAVEVFMKGKIKDTENDLDELNLIITFSDNFRYDVTGPKESTKFISMNQKYGNLPHLMICNGYAYDAQTSPDAPRLLFALDLEKEYGIFVFANSPDCYLVASMDDTVDYHQILSHFEDFIEDHVTSFWST